MKKRQTKYEVAVAWIADNDESGADDALDLEVVNSYISVKLVADVFGRDSLKVAADVIKVRKKSEQWG